MTQETRYRYEKRIKELEDKVNRLSVYRELAFKIFDVVATLKGSETINTAWLLSKFRECLK